MPVTCAPVQHRSPSIPRARSSRPGRAIPRHRVPARQRIQIPPEPLLRPEPTTHVNRFDIDLRAHITTPTWSWRFDRNIRTSGVGSLRRSTGCAPALGLKYAPTRNASSQPGFAIELLMFRRRATVPGRPRAAPCRESRRRRHLSAENEATATDRQSPPPAIRFVDDDVPSPARPRRGGRAGVRATHEQPAVMYATTSRRPSRPPWRPGAARADRLDVEVEASPAHRLRASPASWPVRARPGRRPRPYHRHDPGDRYLNALLTAPVSSAARTSAASGTGVDATSPGRPRCRRYRRATSFSEIDTPRTHGRARSPADQRPGRGHVRLPTPSTRVRGPAASASISPPSA